MSNFPKIAIIAAVGPNRELGRRGDLIWHISADLKNFKRITTGQTVIMGRKTWESLPKRPLPGRVNVVISRSCQDIEGAVCVSSIDAILSGEIWECAGFSAEQVKEIDSTVFIIGGAQIYSEFLPYADILFLTRIDADAGDGVDSWFPEYEDEWNLDSASVWETDPNGVKYRFETWKRNVD